jgi:hypothetical protein
MDAKPYAILQRFNLVVRASFDLNARWSVVTFDRIISQNNNLT